MQIAVGTAAAAIIAPILSPVLLVPGWLLSLAAIGAIAYIAQRQRKTYADRQQAYRRQAARYAKELPAYENRKRAHNKKQEATAPAQIVQWRREQIRTTLARTVPHDGEGSSAPEGRAEKAFRKRLELFFPGKIYANLTHQIPNYPHPYTPDIAYIDRSVHLYIDIEVDEPYVYRSKQATHYKHAGKDRRRNQFFVSKGWIVIRFSEQQVVCYPDSCGKAVAQIIARITENSSIMRQFADVPDLQKQQQWTEEEAVQMAVRKERNRYKRNCKVRSLRSNTNTKF